jgi:hypothetical protein
MTVDRGNQKSLDRQKPIPVSHCAQKIPQGLYWDRIATWMEYLLRQNVEILARGYVLLTITAVTFWS